MSASIGHGLTIRKSTLVMMVVAVLTLTEVFSGALRYYLDHLGLVQVIYLGKVFVIVAIIAKLPGLVGTRLLWAVLLVGSLSCALALSSGATMWNIAFACFVYAPLLFGLLYGEQIGRSANTFFLIARLAWICSII